MEAREQLVPDRRAVVIGQREAEADERRRLLDPQQAGVEGLEGVGEKAQHLRFGQQLPGPELGAGQRQRQLRHGAQAHAVRALRGVQVERGPQGAGMESPAVPFELLDGLRCAVESGQTTVPAQHLLPDCHNCDISLDL